MGRKSDLFSGLIQLEYYEWDQKFEESEYCCLANIWQIAINDKTHKSYFKDLWVFCGEGGILNVTVL